MWVKTVLGSYVGVGEFTTHFSTYSNGDWDVHWGYDLAFDPWPVQTFLSSRGSIDPYGRPQRFTFGAISHEPPRPSSRHHTAWQAIHISLQHSALQTKKKTTHVPILTAWVFSLLPVSAWWTGVVLESLRGPWHAFGPSKLVPEERTLAWVTWGRGVHDFLRRSVRSAERSLRDHAQQHADDPCPGVNHPVGGRMTCWNHFPKCLLI